VRWIEDVQFIYLVQGAWDRLSGLRFPAASTVFALCYDHDDALPGAEETLYDPHCTWAAGRNRLQELALQRYPHADYLILCDDDVIFIEGSFAQFEALLAATRPAIGVPIVPKTRKWNTVSAAHDVQRGLCLDEQMVAMHRSVVGEHGIAPLETSYDAVSWFAACLIFEYLVLKNHTTTLSSV
jgi:hypothetical protein